jgi:hypothetical protein
MRKYESPEFLNGVVSQAKYGGGVSSAAVKDKTKRAVRTLRALCVEA